MRERGEGVMWGCGAGLCCSAPQYERDEGRRGRTHKHTQERTHECCTYPLATYPFKSARAYCSRSGKCIAHFAFLQGLQAKQAQQYKGEAYCRTNWRRFAAYFGQVVRVLSGALAGDSEICSRLAALILRPALRFLRVHNKGHF